MAGLEIYNNNGVMIFDGVRAPLVLQDKITINGSQAAQQIIGTGVNQSTYYLVNVWVSSPTSVIAMQGGPASWAIWRRSGTMVTLVTTNNFSSNVMTIYSFGVSPPVRRNYGLELYDVNGNVIFTSNDKPLKPFSSSELNVMTSNRLLTVNVGSRPTAVVQNNKYAYIWNHREATNTFADTMMAMMSVWNGVVAADGFQIRRIRRGGSTTPIDDPYQPLKRGSITLIDVTNY